MISCAQLLWIKNQDSTICNVAWGYNLFHHLQCPSRVLCSVFCTSFLFEEMAAILAEEHHKAVANKPMKMFVLILDVCTFKIMLLGVGLVLVLWCYCLNGALQHFVDFPDVRKANCSRQAIMCFSIRLFGMTAHCRLLHCFLPSVFIVVLRQIPLRHREIVWTFLSPTHWPLSLSQVLCLTFI